jgi:hypothetical protein
MRTCVRWPALARLACVIVVGALAGNALAANLGVVSAWNPTPGNHMFVTVYEDGFYNYDSTDPVQSHTVSDWPITMVFYGGATVNRVKDQVIGSPFNFSGSRLYQYLTDDRSNPAAAVWDQDAGVKTTAYCPAFTDSDHIRIYADGDDFLYNVDYGMYVLGTTHKDSQECNPDASKRVSGWSEWVEDAVANHVRGKGYLVSQNCCWMFNAEGARLEQGTPDYYWLNNGYATYVYVP